MKKTLFILSLFSLPLPAMAADKPGQMANKTIDAAVKKFGPSFCNKTRNGLRVTAEKIQDCYQQTLKNNSDYEQCILGDEVISSLIQPMRRISGAMRQPKPLTDMPFFSDEQIFNRADEISHYPQYKNYTDKEKNRLSRKIYKSVL